MSTSAERAEDVNAFVLVMEDIIEGAQPVIEAAEEIGRVRHVMLVMPCVPLHVIEAVVAELKEAKLARAKLELRAAP